MTEINFGLENSQEKIKVAKTNLYVFGALSKFEGFGDIIASYYDKNQLQGEKHISLINLLVDWERKMNDIKYSKISSGFFEQKDDAIFFAENFPSYTKFPQHNRFYYQTIYSWIDKNNPDSTNAGKIFSAMKPFKQYSEKSNNQDKIDVKYNTEELPISEKLKDLLKQCLESPDSDKKLLIKAYINEGEELLGEQALEYPPIKTLLTTFDSLPSEQRKNFGLFFGDVDQWRAVFNDKKIAVLTKQPKASFEEYYKSKGSIFVDWKDLI